MHADVRTGSLAETLVPFAQLLDEEDLPRQQPNRVADVLAAWAQ